MGNNTGRTTGRKTARASAKTRNRMTSKTTQRTRENMTSRVPERRVQASARVPERRRVQASSRVPERRREQASARPQDRARVKTISKRTSGAVKQKDYGRFFDFSLLFLIIFLLCFGLIMLYSTSSYEARTKFADATFYLRKQLRATLLGGVAMFLVFLFGYKRLKIYAVPLYCLAICTIPLVKTPLGVSSNGASRWINIGIGTIQPAEFAKWAVIILMARVLSKYAHRLRHFSDSVKIFLIAGFPAILVFWLTKNMSSAIIICFIGIVMMYVAAPKKNAIIQLCICVAALGMCALLISSIHGSGGYRTNRIKVWRNPETYSAEGGYQIVQGLYAIGSGGLFGKGLGQSVQKLGFVPEAQNDYIFAIICEELGLFGGIAVIAMFLFMIWRFMVISNNAPDLFSALLVVGTMAHIAIQVLMNVAVVTNTMPNTGVTLPFISYGGTSVMFLLAEMGMVLAVSYGIKNE